MTPSLSTHVTSLSLSQEMKRLGFPQVSLFYYQIAYGGGQTIARPAYGRGADPFDGDKWNISAYLSSELGEMLSDGLSKTWKSSGGDWYCEYITISETDVSIHGSGRTEADALANLLIHLAKEGLLLLDRRPLAC